MTCKCLEVALWPMAIQVVILVWVHLYIWQCFSSFFTIRTIYCHRDFYTLTTGCQTIQWLKMTHRHSSFRDKNFVRINSSTIVASFWPYSWLWTLVPAASSLALTVLTRSSLAGPSDSGLLSFYSNMFARDYSDTSEACLRPTTASLRFTTNTNSAVNPYGR